jgi:hypothetical protein
MGRFLWALSAATMLAVTALAPSASAATGHVRHATHKRAAHARHTRHTQHTRHTTKPADSLSVVYLGPDFSQSWVKLTPGQLLLVSVRASVRAMVTDPAAGSSVEGGRLGDDSYLFAAIKAGTTTIPATVRPKCDPWNACPQWIAMPKLTVTVTS